MYAKFSDNEIEIATQDVITHTHTQTRTHTHTDTHIHTHTHTVPETWELYFSIDLRLILMNQF